MKCGIFVATLELIPNIYCIYKHWISTMGLSTFRQYVKISKI